MSISITHLSLTVCLHWLCLCLSSIFICLHYWSLHHLSPSLSLFDSITNFSITCLFLHPHHPFVSLRVTLSLFLHCLSLSLCLSSSPISLSQVLFSPSSSPSLYLSLTLFFSITYLYISTISLSPSFLPYLSHQSLYFAHSNSSWPSLTHILAVLVSIF